MRSHRWERARLLVGLLVGGVLLWIGLRGLGWQDFADLLTQAKWTWLILSWLTILLGTTIKALRWKWLLGGSDGQPKWLRLMAILTTGQLVNAVIPSRLGELTRAYLVSRVSDNTFALTLGSVAVEKALDGTALLGLTAVLALNIGLPGWFGTAVLSFGAVFALLFVALLWVTFRRERLLLWSSRLPGLLRRFASTGLEGLSTLRRWQVLFPAALFTLLVWLLGFATNYCIFVALRLPPMMLGSLLLLLAHYLAVLIPGVPAQLGLFHYVTVLALGVFDMGQELSMPYAVVLHALIYGTIIVLGAVSASWLSLDLGALGRKLRAMAQEMRQFR